MYARLSVPNRSDISVTWRYAPAPKGPGGLAVHPEAHTSLDDLLLPPGTIRSAGGRDHDCTVLLYDSTHRRLRSARHGLVFVNSGTLPARGRSPVSVPTCHAGQSSSVQQIYSQIDCIHHIAQETSERIFRKSRTLIISPFRDFCGERNSLLTLRACFVYRGRAPPAPQEWVSAGPVSLRSAWLVARAPVPLLEHKWGEI